MPAFTVEAPEPSGIFNHAVQRVLLPEHVCLLSASQGLGHLQICD